jgi:hypothetical protein
MELRDAIAKTAKFAWKGKQKSPTKGIRFMPGANGHRSALYATNGPQGLMVFLDPGIDVPNCLLDAERLEAVIKGVKHVDIEGMSNGNVTLSGVTVPSGNVTEFPAIPNFPASDFHDFSDWWIARKLLSVVSKDAQQPLLQCLHFRNDLIEASDRFRIIRAWIRTPWQGLVPGSIFAGLRDEKISAAFGADEAVFRCDDELRFTILKRGTFQDCDSLVPMEHKGPRIIVEKEHILDRISRARSLDPICEIALSCEGATVRGSGYGGIASAIHSSEATSAPVMLKINTTWLFMAIRDLYTPHIAIGYTGPGDPIRIESGVLVTAIWPFQGV